MINKNLSEVVVGEVNKMLHHDISPLNIYDIYTDYLEKNYPADLFSVKLIPAGIYVDDDVLKSQKIDSSQLLRYLNKIKDDMPKITEDIVRRETEQSKPVTNVLPIGR